MRRLIESLGKYIEEGSGKRSRKKKMRRRGKPSDVKIQELNRDVYRTLKAKQNDIVRFFNSVSDWDVSGNVAVDSNPTEEGHLAFEIIFNKDYPISVDGEDKITDGTANYSVYVTIGPAGKSVNVSAGWSDLEPTGPGVSVSSGSPDENSLYDAVWKQKRKPFNPEKDLMPLVKDAMRRSIKDLPYYNEAEVDSDTERDVFGGRGGFARWSNPSLYK